MVYVFFAIGVAVAAFGVFGVVSATCCPCLKLCYWWGNMVWCAGFIVLASLVIVQIVILK